MRITEAWLTKHGACAYRVAKFTAIWPDGAEMTEANLLLAADADLPLDWLARRLPIWEEYERQEAPIRAKYERQEALTWEEFERQLARLIWRLWQSQEEV